MDTPIKHLYSEKNIVMALAIVMFLAFCIYPVMGRDTKVSDLKKLYQNYCAKCHGPDGSAIGEGGKKLKGKNFTDQKYLAGTKDEKMVKIILNGKFFSLAMPAFKEILTKDEVQMIVTEIIRKSEKGKIIAP